VRTEEDIQKEIQVFLGIKLLVCLLTISVCTALWIFGQHWSLVAKVISFGGLLIILGITFVVGIMERGAQVNSSSGPSALSKYSGLANGVIALTFLLTVATGIGLAFK
jgi:hypothetical protein